MKQSWITRLALIGFSAFLVTGCYNGWSNEGQGKSSAAPDTSESQSSEPDLPPLPEEDLGVDLTYPFRGGQRNPITDEQFMNIGLNATGATSFYDSFKNFFGTYLYRHFLATNHFTEDEMAKTMAFVQAFFGIDEDNVTSKNYYNWFYYVAEIDTDHLLATCREIVNDPRARGEFMVMFNNDFSSRYIEANDILNGSNPDIKQMADQEKAILETSPEFLVESAVGVHMIDLVSLENSEVILRFLHRFFRCMIINLTIEEIGFTVAQIGMPIVDFEDCADYVNEHLLQYINHIGDMFSMLNISSETYRKCYPFFEVFLELVYLTDSDDFDPLDYGFVSKYQEIFASLFETLDPEGFRALIKFIGFVGVNFTEEHLCCLLGMEYGEGESAEVPSYECILDLYNEQYGLLTSSEKSGMRAAAASFGIDFDELITRLTEACEEQIHGHDGEEPSGLMRESDDDDEGSFERTVGEILDELVTAQVYEKFYIGEPDIEGYASDELVLMLRKGTQFSTAELTAFLKDSRSFRVRHRGEITMRDSDYGFVFEERDQSNRTNITIEEPFDTATCGLKFAHITYDGLFYNYRDSTEKTLHVNAYVPYYVIADNVSVLVTNIECEIKLNNAWVRNGCVYEDSNHAKATSFFELPQLQKDANYAEGEFVSDIYLSDVYFYNTDLKVFERAYKHDNEIVYNNVNMSALDVSTVGKHIHPITATIQKNNQVIRTVTIFFAYEVREVFPEHYDVDHITPVE